jgi:tetratricopeptide (TPR) repeat protein
VGTFFLEFHDPLFGVIVFFILVFVITFFSYWWSQFKRKSDSKQLDNFLESFRTLPTQKELEVLISSGELSEKSWLLLAQSYSKNGDYEKSIEIYNELLKVSTSTSTKEIMFLLGKTYFKAGFLQRSKKVFLQILKNTPRTPEALKYLLLVYEHLRDYSSALDVIESLDELDNDIKKDSSYINALALIYDTKKTDEEKSKKLLEIYKQNNQSTYLVFEYIFRIDSKLGWSKLDPEHYDKLIDVFWNIDKKDLDFDIISKNDYLSELYTARGDINTVKKSSIFEFDVLINLKDNSNATLNFEYVCDNCKQTYPFAFNRCSSCHSIDTQIVEYSLTKDYRRDFSEENNSFQ